MTFLRKKITIIMGCFWHRCQNFIPRNPKTNSESWNLKFKNNIERDNRKFNQLLDLNWKVLFFWECQIKNDLDSCITSLKNELQ
jgi:DNA mismatch endonuclease Vsr